VQPDGRIVVAGGANEFVAARYLGGGTPRTCRGEPERRARIGTAATRTRSAATAGAAW
jgi:hypothetical protein